MNQGKKDAGCIILVFAFGIISLIFLLNIGNIGCVILFILSVIFAVTTIWCAVSDRRAKLKEQRIQWMGKKIKKEYRKRLKGAKAILQLLDNNKYCRLRYQEKLVLMLENCAPTGLDKRYMQVYGPKLAASHEELNNQINDLARCHHVEIQSQYDDIAAMRRHARDLLGRYQELWEQSKENHRFSVDDYAAISRQYQEAIKYDEW